MSISLKPCDINDDGFIIEYTIIKNKKFMGGLFYCPNRKRWQIISVSDNYGLTLIDVAEIWSRLIDRLSLENGE